MDFHELPSTPTRPRARSTPTCAPAKLRHLASYLSLYLPYPTLRYWPPHPRDLHTTCSLPRLHSQRLFLPVSLAREARNGKSTRNRMTVSVTSIPVALRNIRIENFNIQNCREIVLCILKCNKTPVRETELHDVEKEIVRVLAKLMRAIPLKNELFLINISRTEEIKGLEHFKSM